MRKFIAALIMLVVLGGRAFAVEREALHVFEGESYFEKSGVTGSQQTGNPGYLVLQGTDLAANTIAYYLWVNDSGKLMIASYATISLYSSFPSGDWRSGNQNGFKAGTVVGSQS